MTDSDHSEHMGVLQQIILRLTREHTGSDPALIRAELEASMEQAGLATGATKWLDDTASEIAAGRVVVTDARHDIRPDESRG